MKTFFLNPFERYSEKILLWFGVLSTIIGSAIGWLFNARFDGMMDMHFPGEVFWAEPFIDNLINVAFLSLVLFLIGRYINRKTRFIDILAVATVARIPIYFLPLANVNNYIFNVTKRLLNASMQLQTEDLQITTIFVVFVFAMITLAFMIWFFILLWNGFKVATNAKGIKHILLFILALLVCEIFTKILILSISW